MKMFFEVRADDAKLGLECGDVLIVDPGGPDPVMVIRQRAYNVGYLLGLLADDLIAPITDCRTASSAMALIDRAVGAGDALPVPPSPPRGLARHHLRRLK